MAHELRPTLGRIRALQFLDAQDLSIEKALCAGDIGELSCPTQASNKRAWGATQINILRKHNLVEPVGRTTRGMDTWAITDLGVTYLSNNEDVITINHWKSPWDKADHHQMKKLVNNG